MLHAIKEQWVSKKEQVLSLWNRADSFLTKRNLAIVWVTAVLYRITLDLIYIFAASPQYAYAGLILEPVSWKYIISWCMYLLLFFLLPKQEKSTVMFLLHLQFAYIVAPMLSFYALANGSSKYMLMVFVCILTQILLLRKPVSAQKMVHITGIKNYTSVLLGVIIIISLIVPILYNGFAGMKAFDFSYIYEMRANATYPPGFVYLFGWAQKIIVPFAILYSFHNKKYGWGLLCIAIQILFYMESGWKGSLFALVPILGIYFLAKSGHLIKLMYAALSAVLFAVLICFLYDRISRESSLGITLNSLIPIRALYIPAFTKFEYYECFQIFPHTYFSDGMIGKILGLTYLFAGSVGHIVYAFSGGSFMDSNSNTGYLGDAYAQMGFAGMLLMSLLLAAILRGIQNYDRKEHTAVLTALFSLSIITLNDGALFTTLLTGGTLIAFLLVSIYLSSSSKGDSHGIQRI